MRNILFLCTGNSARSIMAEAYMNKAGAGRWRAWSAGSNPADTPNPFALETLSAQRIPIPGGADAPRSKSWEEFSRPDAPLMDAVVTVCDNAAGETCPVWPLKDGRYPHKMHWSFPDPAAVTGSDAEKRAAFLEVFTNIKLKIDDFLSRP